MKALNRSHQPLPLPRLDAPVHENKKNNQPEFPGLASRRCGFDKVDGFIEVRLLLHLAVQRPEQPACQNRYRKPLEEYFNTFVQ